MPMGMCSELPWLWVTGRNVFSSGDLEAVVFS